MQLLDTGAGMIAYGERGSGDPVVFLPAGAHTHADFGDLLARLPDGYRTIAVDWPGHGACPPPDALGSAMLFADLAEELVARLAPGGAVVVGNSVGGFSAARLAIRRPDLVKGLVLVDSGGFLGRPPQVRAFCASMGRPGFLRRIYPAFSARYMRARTAADAAARERSIATTRNDPGLGVVAGLWRSFASPEHDLRADAGRIEVPTLVIWGKKDPVIPLRAGKRVAGSIPGARLAVLDTGHVPHTSDPDGVAAELVPFAEAAFAAPHRVAA